MKETNDVKTDDAMSRSRQICAHWLTHDLRTKKEKDATIFRLIDTATSVEQLREIACAMAHAALTHNPHLYRQLGNGNWILRENDRPRSAGNRRTRRAKGEAARYDPPARDGHGHDPSGGQDG